MAGLLALCAACGGGRAPGPGEPTRVVLWEFGGVPGHREWIREAVKRYNASHRDIQVELEFRDWATQRESLISTTIAGEGPDLIRVHHKYAVEFGELGGLYALESFADFPQVRARILDNVWEQVEYQGRHYGLPTTMLPFVLAVNRDLLARHGLTVPRTWEEMVAMGPALQQQGIHVFTMPGGVNLDTAYRFCALLYRAGGRVLNEDWTAPAFNGPAGVAALSFLLTLKERGFLPPACAAYSNAENIAQWTTDKALFSIEGPWWQSTVAGDYGFDVGRMGLAQVPRPERPAEGRQSHTLLDVVMISITGYSRVPQQAWTVLKELNVGDPVWRSPNPAMGGIPTQKAAYAPGIPTEYIDLEALAAAGADGLGWPGHPAITEIQRHIADAVNMALSGRASASQALDAAAAEVDEVLHDF
ncbi:MAG: extracellular solute-binding protein [Candidatus Latescibacterota bacterium]